MTTENIKIILIDIPRRHYFKWNINEILNLEREKDLLELPDEEIAVIHERSIKAIQYKYNEIKNNNF
jgi:hypothetical protein